MSQSPQTNFRKIIGFDMDGVIIDHTDLKISLVKERGFDFNRVQVQGDVFQSLLPQAVYLEIKDFLYNNRRTALSQPIMVGAENGLALIKNSGVPYFLISRRRHPAMAQELLKLRGLWPTYFNKDNAFFVLTREDKNNKAKELGVTHYIDDEPSVLEKLVDVPNLFLFDPYEAHPKSGYVRLLRWSEFMRYVD